MGVDRRKVRAFQLRLTVGVQEVDVLEERSGIAFKDLLGVSRRQTGVVGTVLRKRHTDHRVDIVLTKALCEVGKVLPLIIQSGVGTGRYGVLVAL